MERCNCENSKCEKLGDHLPGGCRRPAGKHRAMYIGAICDICAKRMDREYMLSGLAMDFYVAVVDNDPRDSHAARSPKEALELANPDPGSRIDIYIVDADDAGEARLIWNHPVRGGTLIRTLKKH